jgi:RecA/RadA recombinase
MNAILYGNLSVEIVNGLGGKIERFTARQTLADVFRVQPVAPILRPVILGRERQAADAFAAIHAGRPVEFYGGCGYGKTTLLQHVIAEARELGVAASCVYVRANQDRVGDLLQQLVSELFSSERRVKLTPAQCAHILGQVNAVIAVDDVSFGPDQVSYLLDILPRSSVVMGSPRPVIGPRGSSYPMRGIPDEAGLALIASCLLRPLSSEEFPAVRQLIAAVDGQPLHLRQAAELVRKGEHSFQSLARKAARDPDVLDRLSVNAVAERERRTLAVLALAAGVMLPADVVAVIGQIAYLGESLNALYRRGLAEQRNDRFGLPICKAESYRHLLLEDLHLAASARELAGWLSAGDPTTAESLSAAEAALTLIEFAAERGEWTVIVRLARAAEPVLFIMGRWEAWHHTLSQGLNAAMATGDKAAEAFFSHQLGTLAFCQDRLDEAVRLLHHALRLREQIGDQDGARVTRHNVRLLEPQPPPPPPPRPRWLRILTVAGIIGVLVLSTAVIANAMRGHTSGPGPPTSTSSPTFTPTTSPSTRTTSPGPSGRSSPGSTVLTLSPATLPAAPVGRQDAQRITAAGGAPPYRFSVTSGSLPAGLSLNSGTGDISGTPTTAGTYHFTIAATDASSTPDTGSRAYTLQITSQPVALTLSPSQLPDATTTGECPAVPYTETITASGGTGPYSYSVTSGTLPDGMSLNSSTGVISGTPTTQTTYTFTVTATDSSPVPNTGAQSYSIRVDPCVG